MADKMKNRDRVRRTAYRVARTMGPPRFASQFADYAEVVVHKEARGNPRAGVAKLLRDGEWRSNKARGLIGTRPETMRGRGGITRLFPTALLAGPLELQVVLLAWNAHRAVKYKGASTWRDVAAWMAYPRLGRPGVQGQREEDVKRRLAASERKQGATFPWEGDPSPLAVWPGWGVATLAAIAPVAALVAVLVVAALSAARGRP